nr:hypothetical protein [Tanacetum cinerariifolium]
MLKKFMLEDSKPTKMPMSTEIKLTKDDEADSVDSSKYQENPKTTHLEAVKHIFRYIRGTMHLGLWYSKGNGIETIVYANSDHTDNYVDRKSTSGVCTFTRCCLTSWFAKKQTTLAISMIEAKYVSVRKACQPALWMKQVLIDYDIRLDDVSIIMSPELQKTLENYKAYDMIQEIKTMFEEQAKQELSKTVKAFHTCKQEDGHMGKTLAELHAMLKLHEKGISKKAETPEMLAIWEGKIQKDKKKLPGVKGKGNGNNKLVYALKAKIPSPTKRDNPKKDSICRHCKEVPKCHANINKITRKLMLMLQKSTMIPTFLKPLRDIYKALESRYVHQGRTIDQSFYRDLPDEFVAKLTNIGFDFLNEEIRLGLVTTEEKAQKKNDVKARTSSKNGPSMLNKDNYVPWSSLLRDTDREIPVNETFHEQTDDELTEKELKQVEADDQAIQTILLGLPEEIYEDVDSRETTQEIWLRVQQMMKGSNIGIQEKKAKLFNEWKRFISTHGESIESYLSLFLKVDE